MESALLILEAEGNASDRCAGSNPPRSLNDFLSVHGLVFNLLSSECRHGLTAYTPVEGAGAEAPNRPQMQSKTPPTPKNTPNGSSTTLILIPTPAIMNSGAIMIAAARAATRLALSIRPRARS